MADRPDEGGYSLFLSFGNPYRRCLPLRRQATPLNPANFRSGEMFPRRALFEHRLLTPERRDQMHMIWHHDRISQNSPVTFEMEQAVQNDLRELGRLQHA